MDYGISGFLYNLKLHYIIMENGTLLLQYIRNERRNGYSPIIEVVGRQRKGKTLTAMRLGYELDGAAFKIEEQLKVNAIDVIRAYDKFNGRTIIYDEVGKDLDVYRAMDDINRAISHVIQSQAYKTNVLLLVLPFASDLGKSHRKHVNAVIYVYARGCYRLYSTYSWHADINDTPIRMKLMEDVRGVPLPPKHILDFYKANIEKQTKQDILEQELNKLTNRELLRQKLPRHSAPSLAAQIAAQL
jgi:hypothetical protein